MTQQTDDGIPSTPRSTVKRIADRGVYDRSAIYRILDEALLCHVGFIDDGQPYVLPTIHARIDDALYLHGSQASRMLSALAGGAPACVTVTLLDGIVVARSAFHSSMNYRSVVVLGSFREVTDTGEKSAAFEAIVRQVIPGRWDDVRRPTENESNATGVLVIPLNETSAKVRTGPPSDDDADYALPHWAGVIPMELTPGTPIADPKLAPGIPTPDYIARYTRHVASP